MDSISYTCTNCALRHDMCMYDPCGYDKECPEFVLGKCWICKHYPDGEALGICMSGDMSGYGCHNFSE